jgi:two-component system, OmpR family, phosphate regulon sensor histidine kinase PhoR
MPMTHVRIDVAFDALAQWISDGIAFVGLDGIVTAWSSGAAAITGIDTSEALGRPLDGIFARIEPQLALAVVPQTIEFWTSDERRRVRSATILSVDGGWLVSFGRESQFAAIEQLKNEIVAAVSHELKTPIATIKAFATTMRQNPEVLAEDRGDFLATIEEQADRLARAVEDLLLVGRVDAKHLLSTRETVALDRLIDSAAARLGPTAAARIERRSTALGVSGDPELLGAALYHLIENALKFSPEGSPVAIEGNGEGDSVAVRVLDRGIGIGEEHIPYIFERFYRVDRNLTATAGGSGLGLTIVREIVQAHGGTVAVDSTPSAGTTVTIVLPARGETVSGS